MLWLASLGSDWVPGLYCHCVWHVLDLVCDDRRQPCHTACTTVIKHIVSYQRILFFPQAASSWFAMVHSMVGVSTQEMCILSKPSFVLTLA